jgi:RimJ/RimL family protein N-acetyltransferase
LADRPPAWELRLPGAWREDAGLVAGLDWRRRVAGQVGLLEEFERLQWRWAAGTPLRPSSGRLRFAPEADDAAFLDVFRRVAVGSLDVTTSRAVRALGEEAAARDDLRFYRSATGDRGWWRLARDAEGTLVGFVIPSATPSGPNVGYLGVVPAARGHRYVDDLLAEATRFHAQRGAAQISATTDITNLPMAAALARHGYVLSERRLVFSAPPTASSA